MTGPPPVTLTVPCLARYARVVRTVAASCAALEMVDLLAGVLAADASVVHAEGLSIRATISEVLT